jgi:hypothetical protein
VLRDKFGCDGGFSHGKFKSIFQFDIKFLKLYKTVKMSRR